MNFEFDDNELTLCQKEFNKMAPEDRLFMTHYELAKQTTIKDSALWKKFLLDSRVSDWINQELTLFKSAQLRKLVKDATKNDRSVGAAQMLNALNKTLENESIKEGPVFIYSYVPLNERELNAPNVRILGGDVSEA